MKDNGKGEAMSDFSFNHFNFNVLDLQRSMRFYEEALDLHELSRNEQDDFIIVYLGDDSTDFRLELTYLKNRSEAYDLGEQEFHLALRTVDIGAAHDRHEKMGCICFENHGMGIYFIEDPDGYWIEIIPDRTKPITWR